MVVLDIICRMPNEAFVELTDGNSDVMCTVSEVKKKHIDWHRRPVLEIEPERGMLTISVN